MSPGSFILTFTLETNNSFLLPLGPLFCGLEVQFLVNKVLLFIYLFIYLFFFRGNSAEVVVGTKSEGDAEEKLVEVDAKEKLVEVDTEEKVVILNVDAEEKLVEVDTEDTEEKVVIADVDAEEKVAADNTHQSGGVQVTGYIPTQAQTIEKKLKAGGDGLNKTERGIFLKSIFDAFSKKQSQKSATNRQT